MDMTVEKEPTNLYARRFFQWWVLALLASVGFRLAEDPVYKNRIDQWHQQRLASLTSENGWLNLAGLFWLKNGDNTVGTARGSDVVFPKGASQLGVFQLANGSVQFTPSANAGITMDGKPIAGAVTIFTDGQSKPVVLQQGSLRWFIIKRGDRYGIRLRDLESPVLKAFKGIERFPVSDAWQTIAHVEVPAQPKTIPILDVLGVTSQQPLAGTLVFRLNGQSVRLDAVGEGDKLFVLFADETNRHETYGAGRFLYVDKPGPDGTTTVDFNQAINPPCAFTPYATCPLPPNQNRLALRVTAGEKNASDH